MSNKAQRVESRGPCSTRRSRVLYGALEPHTKCFITHTAHTVHARTNLLCFSSVKHKTVLYYKDSSAVCTASSFDLPTQNPINAQ